MSGPTPRADLRPLFHLADQFEAQAETVRARATTVGFSPRAMGWYSQGAREFARSAEEASAALLVVARRLEHTAAELRALAASVVARAGGR